MCAREKILLSVFFPAVSSIMYIFLVVPNKLVVTTFTIHSLKKTRLAGTKVHGNGKVVSQAKSLMLCQIPIAIIPLNPPF